MAIAIQSSFQQHFLNTGPVSGTASINNGGNILVYAAGTTTPLTLYSNDTLLTTRVNPVVLDSAGRHAMVYIAAGTKYKLVVRDSANNVIHTDDNIDPGVATNTTLSIAGGGTGATTASGARTALDVPSNADLTALASDVTALDTRLDNLSLISTPQGYLTLSTGVPVISGDVAAATSVYYTPFVGNGLPLYNGSSYDMHTFDEMTLTLAAQHLASNIYDVFAFLDGTTLRIGTGPAWSVASAGSGARGTGAGTTELELIDGFRVNKVAITARNGVATYSVAAQRGLYLGSLYMDGTNGQITCHRTWGQSRKWGVWNAFNRNLVALKVGDSTASWTHNAGLRIARNTAGNSLTVFAGLAEEQFDCSYAQSVVGAVNTTEPLIAVGYNSTSASSGITAWANISGTITIRAEHVAPPALGINAINALEQAVAGTPTFNGTEPNMLLLTKWMA